MFELSMYALYMIGFVWFWRRELSMCARLNHAYTPVPV